MPKISYDNVTILDNMTRQCDTVMSPDGHVDFNDLMELIDLMGLIALVDLTDFIDLIDLLT